MKSFHSVDNTSRFVVMDRETDKVVPDVFLLFPRQEHSAVGIVRAFGHTQWADELDKYWNEVEGDEETTETG